MSAGLLLLLFFGTGRARASVDSDFAAAQAASEAGRDAEAFALADQELAEVETGSGPDDARTLEAVGRHGYYAYLARRDGALKADLRRLSAVRPPTVTSLRELAHLLRVDRRDKEALAAARRAVKLGPADPGALQEQGEALLALRRVDEALVFFSSAAALAPDDYWLHIRLAHVYRLAGRDEDAAGAYRQARAVAAGQQLSIAEAYSRAANGDRQGAIRDFAAMAAASPTDPIPLHHWAQALFLVGRSTESIAKFEQARRLFEAQGRLGVDYVHTLNNLAHVYAALGRRAEAAATAQAALPILGKLPSPYWASTVGSLLVALHDDVPQVARVTRRALETCSKRRCPTVVDSRLRVVLARAEVQLGRRREALDQAERGLKRLDPFRLGVLDGACGGRARQLVQAGEIFELYGRRKEAGRAYALAEEGARCMPPGQDAGRILLAVAGFRCRAGDMAGEAHARQEALERLASDAPGLRAKAAGAAAACPPFSPPDASGPEGD